ncbi:MAG: hypothetical protein KAW12_30135 [Candidatus Aminicenantes bacterium]|nr:hypothetical protein [Candidatus Aminicenantes bacterium]
MESLTAFKEKLKEKLLDIHWQQWSALGVSSHIKETEHLIDLEALIISSTLIIANYDKRLFSSCLEWIKKNREWVSLSRVKQIGKYFLQVDKQLAKPLVIRELFECILMILKDGAVSKKFVDANDRHIPRDYKDILLTLENRGIAVEPVIQKSSLLQLHFRGIFGINARAEILLYLLLEGKGNSNQIAREIFYDQKIVFKILKRWTASGFVEEEKGGKENLYFLKSGRPVKYIKNSAPAPYIFQDINIKEGGKYINWTRFFYFFSRLLVFSTIEPWSEDRYLLSSVFRDMAGDAALIARYFDVSMPVCDLYKGEEFFSPFVSGLFKILKQ